MHLPESTRSLWEYFATNPHLGGFSLIGGTALTLQIQHRISHNLDFFWGGDNLPQKEIAQALMGLKPQGIGFQKKDIQAQVREFTLEGMDADDFQQDYVSSTGVRLTFFCGKPYQKIIFSHNPSKHVRVATVEELFDSKCVLGLKQARARDIFDLYTLMTRHGFLEESFVSAFEKCDMLDQIDVALKKICVQPTPESDPDYHGLVIDPPSLEIMSNFFIKKKSVIEQLAKKKSKVK